jgi:hypothetical protein
MVHASRREYPITIEANVSIDEARADMNRLQVHALIVVSQDSDSLDIPVLGLVTAYDISKERAATTQPPESREVAIGSYPFAAGFNSKRGEPGILDQISGHLAGLTQILEYLPVALLGMNQRCVWSFQEHVAKPKRFRQFAGLLVYFRMCAYSNNPR